MIFRFIFNKVSGVKIGSPVRFSGVEIGEITQVNISENKKTRSTQIELAAWIDKSLKIPKESKAYISTLGLLGERYIEVIPPTVVVSYLQPGDKLTGIDPVMMQDLINEAQMSVADLQDLIESLKEGEGTLGKMFNDDKLYDELVGFLSDLRSGKGTIGCLLYDDTIYQEIESLVRDVRMNPWKLFWKQKEKNERD